MEKPVKFSFITVRAKKRLFTYNYVAQVPQVPEMYYIKHFGLLCTYFSIFKYKFKIQMKVGIRKYKYIYGQKIIQVRKDVPPTVVKE